LVDVNYYNEDGTRSKWNDNVDFEAVKAQMNRLGYTFVGWYTRLEGGTLVDTSGNISFDDMQGVQTLYARWAKNKVIFDMSGSNDEAFDDVVYTDAEPTVTPDAPTWSYDVDYIVENYGIYGDSTYKLYKNFLGWYIGDTLVSEYDLSTPNLGTVTLKATLTEENFSRHCAGGIMGYAWGTEDTAYPVITNCISAGNVIAQNVGGAGATAGYFLGYVNSTLAVVKDNIATGTLTSESGIYAALGRNNSHEFKAENMTGNALPEGAAYQLTYEATTDAAGAVVAITDKAYETKTTDMNALTSGKYAYELNQAYGSDVLFQTLDGTFAPTLEATGENSVFKTEDGFFNKLPEKPVEPAPTGDSAIIFAVIAVISILGAAVVAKRREF
jgi:uncharacterized repeat protein (TIGR02543 family)